jgi:hypothetical protein
VIFTRKELLVGLEREQQAQSVGDDKQDRQGRTEILGHHRASRQIEFGDCRWGEERDRRHQQQR